MAILVTYRTLMCSVSINMHRVYLLPELVLVRKILLLEPNNEINKPEWREFFVTTLDCAAVACGVRSARADSRSRDGCHLENNLKPKTVEKPRFLFLGVIFRSNILLDCLQATFGESFARRIV